MGGGISGVALMSSCSSMKEDCMLLMSGGEAYSWDMSRSPFEA